MDSFKLKIPLSIRFADFDSLGHVNNANYLTYFEIARLKYFEEIVTGGKVDWQKEGIILAKAVIDFMLPISSYTDYYISIRCSRIGNKSFDLLYLITKEENNQVVPIAEGLTVMVCYDYTSERSIAMKPEWRKAVEDFEGRKFE